MEASRRASRVGSVVGYLKVVTDGESPLSGVDRGRRMVDYVLAIRVMLHQILNAVLTSLARGLLPGCGDKLLNQIVYPIDI
jgi:hypothetical protein